MPLYEHVVISRQDLSNAQAEGLIEHFGKVLSENGGKVSKRFFFSFFDCEKLSKLKFS